MESARKRPVLFYLSFQTLKKEIKIKFINKYFLIQKMELALKYRGGHKNRENSEVTLNNVSGTVMEIEQSTMGLITGEELKF